MKGLAADRAELARFVNAMFKYAAPGTFISLRAFTHSTDNPVMRNGVIPCVCVGHPELVTLIWHHATWVDNYHAPAVFCPPVATFSNNQRARDSDLACGLVLSVECDQRPAQARGEVEALLGPATLVVASGGTWRNPTAGVEEDKLHLHWRLREPTGTREEHDRLKLARRLAAALVGADASSGPVVHPLRWPGTWHVKDPTRPRLARIVAENDSEIDLSDTLEKLEYAARAGAGFEDARPEELSGARPDQHWRKLADGVDQGTTGRIDAVISVFGYLLRRGVDPDLACALAHGFNAECCRPPLAREKVSRALVSIMNREAGRAG